MGRTVSRRRSGVKRKYDAPFSAATPACLTIRFTYPRRPLFALAFAGIPVTPNRPRRGGVRFTFDTRMILMKGTFPQSRCRRPLGWRSTLRLFLDGRLLDDDLLFGPVV